MSEKKDKAYLCFIFGLLLFIFAISGAIIIRISTGLCDKRIEEYAAGSKIAEDLINGTDERLRELEEQMQSAGEQTAESIAGLRDGITELGELQDECDRIAEAGRRIAVTVDGLEGRILKCLQILETPEEDEELLEGNGFGLYDPGGQ